MKTLKFAPLFALGLSSLTIPAWSANLRMFPPPELQLDGGTGLVDINSGAFSLTEITGLYAVAGNVEETSGTPPSVSKSATIGDTSPISLSTIPDTFMGSSLQGLRLIGNFDADNPDLPPAEFYITVLADEATGIQIDGSGNINDDYTYFLPTMATAGDDTIFQTTNLASNAILDDNFNTFTTSAPTLVVNDGVIAAISGGTVIGTSQGNFCGPSSVQFHGSSSSPPQNCVRVPEPSATLGILGLGAVLGVGEVLKRRRLAKSLQTIESKTKEPAKSAT